MPASSSEGDLDRAVRRILTLKFELGLFENPRLPEAVRISDATAAHTALNLDVARRSLVLLRNDGTLPLERRIPGAQIVVGPLADDAQTQLGDWAGSSGQVDWMPDGQPRSQITTVLDGLRELLPSDWELAHARGADILTWEDDPAGSHFPDGQPRPRVVVAARPDEELIAEAVAAAHASDVVVAVVGDRIELVGEGRSTATLELIGAQTALLEALSRPVRRWWSSSWPPNRSCSPRRCAIAACSGSRTPGCKADAPSRNSARPHRALRTPADLVRRARGAAAHLLQPAPRAARRSLRRPHSALHVFGEGLSYSTVEYGLPALEASQVGLDDTVRVHVTVRNTGMRPVDELVQVYVRDAVTSASWADKELKAYRRVTLAAGESAPSNSPSPCAPARSSMPVVSGSSSPAPSTCWSVRHRATRSCRAHGSTSCSDARSLSERPGTRRNAASPRRPRPRPRLVGIVVQHVDVDAVDVTGVQDRRSVVVEVGGIQIIHVVEVVVVEFLVGLIVVDASASSASTPRSAASAACAA
jgi:beta-glucosidase